MFGAKSLQLVIKGALITHIWIDIVGFQITSEPVTVFLTFMVTDYVV